MAKPLIRLNSVHVKKLFNGHGMSYGWVSPRNSEIVLGHYLASGVVGVAPYGFYFLPNVTQDQLKRFRNKDQLVKEPVPPFTAKDDWRWNG